jgi:hypothetical protein
MKTPICSHCSEPLTVDEIISIKEEIKDWGESEGKCYKCRDLIVVRIDEQRWMRNLETQKQ